MHKDDQIFEEISFSGENGSDVLAFIQALRRRAYADPRVGHGSTSAEELASLCFTGSALEWYENLDGDVQTDWGLLRKALIARFPPALPESHSQAPAFTGESPSQCAAFVQAIRSQAQIEGRETDDRWMAQLAGRCVSGSALKWYIGLDVTTRSNWSMLERAILAFFANPPSYSSHSSDDLSAGRINVGRLDEELQSPSFLPKSKEQWLEQARCRRAAYDENREKFRSGVYWVLVSHPEGDGIPEEAFQTGTDTGGHVLYTARAWVEGGLHPGKCGKHIPGAHIPWGTKEHYGIEEYEVLVGNAKAINWIGISFIPPTYWDDSPVKMKAVEAVEGGAEADGTPLLLAQAFEVGRGWQPAKVNLLGEWCQFGWGHKTYNAESCRLLVWA